MFARILTTAFAAGFLAGIVISGLQAFTTLPLIKHAEKFETAQAPSPGMRAESVKFTRVSGSHDNDHHHANDHHQAPEPTGWSADGGVKRFLLTVTANVLVGVGFALIMVACFVFSGRKVDGRTGILWGMTGFAVFTLAPALGLPPELPGTSAGGLLERQGWWVLTAICTAASLWLFVIRREILAKALGVAVLLAPHIVGAPHVGEFTDAVPPELAARFAANSIVVSAVFWALLGWAAGGVYSRVGRAERKVGEALT